jgi:hypothetical protein
MVLQVEQIGRLLTEMASLIASATSTQLPDWFEVFFDQREDGDTGSGISRTIAKSDSSRKWIDIPVSVIGLYGDLLDLRDTAGTGHWYGLFIHIKRTGEVNVKYDYNPDCIETFDDDEENHVPF